MKTKKLTLKELRKIEGGGDRYVTLSNQSDYRLFTGS